MAAPLKSLPRLFRDSDEPSGVRYTCLVESILIPNDAYAPASVVMRDGRVIPFQDDDDVLLDLMNGLTPDH